MSIRNERIHDYELSETEALTATPFTSVLEYWEKLMNQLSRLALRWFTSGTCLMPTLYVDGNLVQFPLTDVDCQRLIQLSDKAPFGHGREKLVDDQVRKAWQIDASRVRFGSSASAVFDKLRANVKEQMGLPEIDLVFYKLLVYETGGHFSAHRDTLRGDRHIGSVIVSLPVADGFQCEGGELLVRSPYLSGVDLSHKTETWAGRTCDFESSYAAFFTDCVHELRPIESGYRVTLAFEMHYSGSIRCDLYTSLVSDSWVKKCKRFISAVLDGNRKLLLIPLKHQYGELRDPAQQLKGTDLIVYQLVQQEKGQTFDVTVQECSIKLSDISRYQYEYEPASFSFDPGLPQRYFYSKRMDPYVILGANCVEDDLFIYSVFDVAAQVEYSDSDDEFSVMDCEQDESFEGDCFTKKIVNYIKQMSSTSDTWYPFGHQYVFLMNSRSSALHQVGFQQGTDYNGNEPAPDQFSYRNYCLLAKQKT